MNNKPNAPSRILLVGGFAFFVAAASAPAREKPAKPNVLFIAIDDLNDWTGTLGGYQGVRTPNLDRLAKRAMTFTRAYCAAPACNPSRAALMTGKRPANTGVYLNSQPWRPALPDAVTLSQHFMQSGYFAAGGGKIFHGRFKEPESWNLYFTRPQDPLPTKRPVNGIPKTAHFDWGPVKQNDEAMGDWKVADWAIKQLQRKRDKPLFLAAGVFRPHLPWYVPAKYFDDYPLDKIQLPKVKADDLSDVPLAGRRMARPEGDHKKVVKSKNWEKAVQGYLASITFADKCVGRILDALENSDHADDTIIVLWSDHGWHLG
ncbi:MAG: sulfatase, partial [Planctomycetales bacterium]